MHRLRPTRTQLLLGLVVVLLATVPVLIPLLWAGSDGAVPAPAALRGAAAGPAGPPVPASASPTATRTATVRPPAPAPAGKLATVSPTPAPTTPSPSPKPMPTTSAPPPAPEPAPTTTPAPTTSEPTQDPTALAAGANLVVVSISWSPDPSDGTPVVFAAVVRNTGSDPTPAVTHGVAFSVDGTEVTWSADSSEPLGPGQERTYTADGGDAGNTWIATTGEHTVQAWVDDLDRIPETNENDNTATAPLTVL